MPDVGPKPGDRVTYMRSGIRDYGTVREVRFNPINGFSIRARWSSVGESRAFVPVMLLPEFEILVDDSPPIIYIPPKPRLCPNRGCQKPNDVGAKACWFCEGVFK